MGKDANVVRTQIDGPGDSRFTMKSGQWLAVGCRSEIAGTCFMPAHLPEVQMQRAGFDKAAARPDGQPLAGPLRGC